MTLGPMQKVLQSRLERAKNNGPMPIDSDLDGAFVLQRDSSIIFVGGMTTPDGKHARVGTVVGGLETSALLDKIALGRFIESLTRIHRSLP